MPRKGSAPSSRNASRSGRTGNCRHCEPTGRANARPMTGSAKQSTAAKKDWIASSLRSSQCRIGKFEMNHDAYADNYIREILNGVKSIAMVGASPVNVRPSYFAFKYLAQRGYDMIQVNQDHSGKRLIGKPFAH